MSQQFHRYRGVEILQIFDSNGRVREYFGYVHPQRILHFNKAGQISNNILCMYTIYTKQIFTTIGPLRIVGNVAYFQQFVIRSTGEESIIGIMMHLSIIFNTVTKSLILKSTILCFTCLIDPITLLNQQTYIIYSHMQGLVPDEMEENELLTLHAPLRNSVHQYEGIPLYITNKYNIDLPIEVLKATNNI